MGRQILTFVLVFIGIMLLMRTCQRPPERAGLAVEQPTPAADDAPLLRHAETGTVVKLGPDGSLASIDVAGVPVTRPVTLTRRPFHLYLGQTASGLAMLPAAEWQGAPVEGGYRFLLNKEGLRVEKTLRLAEDGRGVVLDLLAEGVPAEAVGFVLTGASGVELSTEDAAPSFGFWEREGEDAVKISPQALSQAREEAPDRGFARNERLGADDRVKRFGFVGGSFYVALEDLPPVSELFMDVYRAAREEAQTDEVETWLDLVAREGRYEGSFTLRFLPREEMPESLRKGGELRAPQAFTLEDDTFKVVLSDHGASVREMWLKPFSTEADEPPSRETWVPILRRGAREGERPLTLHADRYGGDPAHDIWEAEAAPDGRSVRFTLQTPTGWRFAKTISLPEPGRYDLGVDLEVRAPEGVPATDAVFRVVGPAASYIEDSYRGIIGADPPASYVLERSGGSDESEDIKSLAEGDVLDRAYADERRGVFKAVGLRGAYFVCALVSEDPRNAVTRAVAKGIRLSEPVERADGESSNENMLGRVSLTLPLENGRGRQSFRLYAGPNETAALRELDIGESVHFGFFGVIGRALMWLMKLLQGLVGSYGVAIMMMTVIVRGLLLPVSYRTQLSMQRYSKRMQKIKPLLEEVQKKYAKDPQRMNQERMKVMREHGVGLPLGCLTIFLQIPIWFALFQALRVEFAIRHQDFLWVADLSMPDRLFSLGHFDAAPLSWLPDWFNLLPILMLVLWVAQQKLAPTPGSDDPQVQMQMKMMKFMPYVFFFMLYNYAAALALYMCISSLWSIAEGRLVRRAIARLG